MFYYKIIASWPKSQKDILELIGAFANRNNFVLLYNGDPDYNEVYLATYDERMISALTTQFELEELEIIDYKKDFLATSNRQWGVTGNPDLVNF